MSVLTMPPTEDELAADRAKLVFEQWPHLDHAHGCLNCNLIFRQPAPMRVGGDTAGRCPGCDSESVFDVAAALAVERPSLGYLVEVTKGMIEQLDAELEAGNGG